MENIQEWESLLRIKECKLRQDLFVQCKYSVDKGIHIGGAQSAMIPLTALFFGSEFHCDIQNPTTENQDIFLLSKGHAVAALASVYANMGYFPEENLKNSRGWNALIKGHPGPVIPGVPVATGPLGQGISIACGYALRQKEKSGYDTYCMVGDGELQEGSCWEGIMFAAERQLDNLCVIVDKNDGQSDDTHKLFLNMKDINLKFEAFGFRVLEADGKSIASVLTCFEKFKVYPRDSRPTVIICQTAKGFGGYATTMGKHKATLTDEELEVELALLKNDRKNRVGKLNRFERERVASLAKKLGMTLEIDSENAISDVVEKIPLANVMKAPRRNKNLQFNKEKLPILEKGKAYGTTDIAIAFTRVFAESPDFYSIDADLSNVSGLYTGTGLTNYSHAINTGIAECNMMCVAEGLAAQGANVWTSTFGPFFNWQALRRIAVSYQERSEVIESGGWLSEGHNLDITFLSTASNLDTAVNGATHMSNDDICFFNQLAHLKVIDICCPQQFLSVAKWIAEGDKGLVYLRIMRNPSPVLYESDYTFSYGKAYYLKTADHPKAVIVSSGHGVVEALAAADLLEKENLTVSVLDMPSYDEKILMELCSAGVHILFAEQNNGALFDKFSRSLAEKSFSCDREKIHALNTQNADKQLRFIQSGSYSQLIEALGLSAESIAASIKAM